MLSDRPSERVFFSQFLAEAMSFCKIKLMMAAVFVFSAAFLYAESMSDFGLLPDSFSWNGCQFKKFSNDSLYWKAALIDNDNDTVRIFSEGFHKNMTRAALVPLEAPSDCQLVIEQFSGGAHCCWSYYVYDLSEDKVRLIFDSSAYPVGYPVRFQDLNGDGKLEWIQTLMTFDYFLVLSHAVSPLIPAVFSLNRDSGRLEPANIRFSDFLLKASDKSRQELMNSPVIHVPVTYNSSDIETFSRLMEYYLTLMYTGNFEKADKLFSRFYTANDRRVIRQQIHAKLMECSLFLDVTARSTEQPDF